MKVVINRCYGGFDLSAKAFMRYAELRGFKLYRYVDDTSYNSNNIKLYTEDMVEPYISYYYTNPNLTCHPDDGNEMFDKWGIKRNDPILVQVIEELGNKANGPCAKLSVVNIPDDVEWEISDYDGIETVEEKHKTWY